MKITFHTSPPKNWVEEASPAVLYFNPGHETAVLNASPYYMPPANVRCMQEDLAYLPAWYGTADDEVLVPETFDNTYFLQLRQRFPALPRPITQRELSHRRVAPWGISPQAIHLLNETAQKQGITLALPPWRDEYRYLNSRTAARDCLMELQKFIPGIPSCLLPQPCTCLDEITGLIRHTSSPLLAKTPYSSSGRGLLWLPPELSGKTIEMLKGMLNKQGLVYIEKVLEKDCDFSMQFFCDGKGNVTFEGYSLFETNERGAYTGNHLYSQQKISSLLTGKIKPGLLEDVKQRLASHFKRECAAFYCGCVGVDMLIYRQGKECRLHPCLEINMRYNMGYLSLRLQQNYLADGGEGRFALDYHAEGCLHQHLQMQQAYPLRTSNGHITNGYLSLCPVGRHTKYHAYVIVR